MLLELFGCGQQTAACQKEAYGLNQTVPKMFLMQSIIAGDYLKIQSGDARQKKQRQDYHSCPVLFVVQETLSEPPDEEKA